MPSRNQARFLAQTLNSALSQTFQDFEIAFVDDGSTDETVAIARTYQDQNPSRIRVHTQEGNAPKGISASTNLAIRNTSGEFIVILDSDDLWLPDTLSRRVAFMQKHPDIGLACSHYDMIDEHGTFIRRKAAPDISEACRSQAGLLHSMIMGCVIGNPTVIVRRSCLEQLAPFDEELLHGDWEIWTRLTALFRVNFMPEVTALHRRHSGNVTGSHSMIEELKRRLNVIKAFERKADATGGAMTMPQIRALIHLEMCNYLFCLGARTEAAEHLVLSLRRNPEMFRDGGVYFNTWLGQRPVVNEPREDFHAWIHAMLHRQLGL